MSETSPGPSIVVPGIPLATSQGIPEHILRLLAAGGRPKSPPPPPALPPNEVALILQSRLTSLLVAQTFERGQLVQWKQGLKNRIRPDYGQPAIVMEVLTAPVYDQSEKYSSSYFREPLDLILGVLTAENNGFTLFHYDRRRFEPFVAT